MSLPREELLEMRSRLVEDNRQAAIEELLRARAAKRRKAAQQIAAFRAREQRRREKRLADAAALTRPMTAEERERFGLPALEESPEL